MKKIILIAIIIIAISVSVASYSQLYQNQNDAETTLNPTEENDTVDITKNEPKSYSVGLNEEVGVAEP